MISHKESHSFLNTDQNCFHRHHKDLMLPNVPDKLCIQACEPPTHRKKHTKNIFHREPSFIRDVSTGNIQYPRRIFLRIHTLRSVDPWPDCGSSTNHFFFVVPISNTIEHTERITIGLFIDNIFNWLLIICTVFMAIKNLTGQVLEFYVISCNIHHHQLLVSMFLKILRNTCYVFEFEGYPQSKVT